MIPQDFPQKNKVYRAPAGFEDSQVCPIPAYVGEIARGSCEGQIVTVVCWQPTHVEIRRIAAGHPIFLTMFGGLAPHMLTTSFEEATHQA